MPHSYQAKRFKAGRSGWAVVLKVYSPNGEYTTVKQDLSKARAKEIASLFNHEIGHS
jgi:hypothetical protein